MARSVRRRDTSPANRGLYLELPPGLAEAPAQPSKVDAERAVRRPASAIPRLSRGARRAGPAGRLRCAFATAVLTAVLRPSLPAAPAILIDANVPGAGKGKAARASAVIATGHLPATISEGHSEEETEKRLAAAILSGGQAILLDNLQRTLASSTLESGLTEGIATIRLFGKLIDVTVPCAALVLHHGKQCGARADMLQADPAGPHRRRHRPARAAPLRLRSL